MLGHVRREYPKEACGLLLGRGKEITRILMGRNVARNPYRDFLLDAETLLRQMDYETAGESLLAIYHSHPHSPPVPSAVDARLLTYPEVVHIICSLQDPLHVRVRGWRLHVEAEDACRSLPTGLAAVPGRAGLWARYDPVSPQEGRYTLAWRTNGGFRCRVVHMREVPLV